MHGRSADLPHGFAVGRFVLGTVALCVLTALATLSLWAVGYPVLRGWSPTVVTSGSMAPSISVGDVLVAGPVEEDRLVPGAVLVFDDPTGDGLVSHRLVETLPEGAHVTRGDANQREDSTPVPPDRVRGIGRLVVPLVGLPIAWASAGNWSALGATAVALALLVVAARWGVCAEFDPWRAPVASRRPRRWMGERLAPFAVAGALAPFVVAGYVAGQPSDAAYTDPAVSAASSITAAGTFP